MTTGGAIEGAGRRPAGSDSGDPDVLTTKLSRPRVPPSFVAAQVAEMLERGTRGPVTVVSAGAGGQDPHHSRLGRRPPGGRSRGVALARRERQRAAAFWACFLAALRGPSTLPPENPLSGLDPASASEDENLRRLMIGLADLPAPVVAGHRRLPPDPGPETLHGLSGILRHPRPSCGWSLLTRADPALPLHRLRVNGELTEIRSSDLAFDAPEAAALLAEDGVTWRRSEAELLVDRTEGWPAGLRLAALFLSRDHTGTVGEFGGDDRAVSDYLLEEVLASQPADIGTSSPQTSVVDRVSAELAAVLTDQPRSQQLLEDAGAVERLRRGPGQRPALVPLPPAAARDAPPPAERLDPPSRRSSTDARPGGSRTAGQPVEALRHAARAEDWSLFGRLFVDQGAPLLVSADRMAIGRVLAQAPGQRFAESAEMELCPAGLMFHQSRLAEMQPTSTRWPPSSRIDVEVFRRPAHRPPFPDWRGRPATAATTNPDQHVHGTPST